LRRSRGGSRWVGGDTLSGPTKRRAADLNPYIAKQPRTPSHERQLGPSTLISRGKVGALGQRCAAADKLSVIDRHP
jgi:hypothetical protein